MIVKNDNELVQLKIQNLLEKSLASIQPQFPSADLREMDITLELQRLSVESQTHLAEEFEYYAADHLKK